MRSKPGLTKVNHLILLGAHRYTTCGGIVRPAGSSLRLTCQNMFESRATQRQRTEGINGNKKS